MSTATVNGAEIACQLFGQGPLLVWTEGGRFGRNEFSYMVAGRLARTYTVLLWDRRNCCDASAVALSEAPNWMRDDVEDLHALFQNAETADDAAAVPTDAHYSERLHPVLPAMEAFLARTLGD